MPRRAGFVLFILLLTACSNDQRILEDLGMIQVSAYDLAADNKIKVTVALPYSDPVSKVTRLVLSETADSSKEARLQFSRQTDLIMVSGQMRNTLFGSSMAEQGLKKHIDTLLRDPSVALGVHLTVVNGNAGEFLAKNYPPHIFTGQYVLQLLSKEGARNIVPVTRLYEFTRDYNDDGIDPVAPIVKDAGKNAAVDGIALFQDDRYRMKIPVKDGIIFNLFRENIKQGELALELGGEKKPKDVALLSAMSAKRKVKVKRLSDKHFKVDINVSVQGSVLEYTGRKMLDIKNQRNQVEADMAEYITSHADKMVKEMQLHNVDSLGIGQYVRNSLSYREWKSMNWREVYPKIQINCHTKVLIKNYGKYRRT